MPANFSKAIPIILDIEKGYSNDINDRGGETKFGISKHQYPDIDIKNLTQQEALAILEKDYWNFYRLNELNNQLVANKIFIFIVNTNPQNAVRAIQKAISSCLRTPLILDGALGTNTINLLNSAPDINKLLTWITMEEIRFYISLVTENNQAIKEIKGWINRALK
jgi:lysozyme family protein